MTINERIRELRNDKKLTQHEFAQKIGLKHGAVSKMEINGNTITDQNKQIICDKFNVNIRWLEDGEEPMYLERDLFDQLRDEYKLTGIEEQILRLYCNLEPSRRSAIWDKIQTSLIDKEEKPAPPEQTELSFSPKGKQPAHAPTPDEIYASLSDAEREEAMRQALCKKTLESSSTSQNGNAATGTDDACPF